MRRKPEIEATILRLIERHFAPDLPATRFARNVALVSLAGLLPAPSTAKRCVANPGVSAT